MKTAIMRGAFKRVKGSCAIAAAAILGASCDNNHSLGAVDTGIPPGNDAGSTPGKDASLDLGQPVTSFAQSWTGYVENYLFASGSDAVKIAFTPDATGIVIGAVTLGSGTPPPPPTDPNVGYPPDLVNQGITAGPPMYIAEGYSYSMQSGTLSGRRLQFEVNLWELWTAWCAIETPVDNSGSCLPNQGVMIDMPNKTCGQFNPATQAYVPVDCGKLMLCFGFVCACDAATSSCTLSDMGRHLTFDVTITTDGSAADGSAGGLSIQNNVHFTKDP
jgi:hypothetical protein